MARRPAGKCENIAISSSIEVGVEVEAELGKILKDISNCVVCQITAQLEIFLSKRPFKNHTSVNLTPFTITHSMTEDTLVILTSKVKYKIARRWCTLFWVTR